MHTRIGGNPPIKKKGVTLVTVNSCLKSLVGCVFYVGCTAKPAEKNELVSLTSHSDVKITQVMPATAGYIRANPNEHIEFVFELHNGPRQLSRLRLAPNCRCIIGQDLPADLAPNSKAQFSIQFNAPRVGRTKELVRVECSTGQINSMELVVEVDAVPPVVLDKPGELRFVFVDGSEKLNKVSLKTLERPDSPPWLSTTVACDSKLLTFEGVDIENGQQVQPDVVMRTYHYKFAAGRELSKRQEQIVMRFSNDSEQVTSVIVHAHKIAEVESIPSRLVFNDAGPKQTRSLLIVFRDKDHREIEFVSSTGDQVTVVAMESNSSDSMRKFAVSIDGTVASGSAALNFRRGSINLIVPVEIGIARPPE